MNPKDGASPRVCGHFRDGTSPSAIELRRSKGRRPAVSAKDAQKKADPFDRPESREPKKNSGKWSVLYSPIVF
jgi:hypothetical protein